VQLPNDPEHWPAGFYTLSVLVTKEGGTRTTNELPLSLAPRINTALPITVARANSDATVILKCGPKVTPDQRATLLLGDREIKAQPHSALTDQLTFVIPSASAGTFFVRMRVDGVDSLLVDRSVKPPIFDATQKVTIT
jgi:hypothetical protein